jgi:formate dehydrogenase iron-sulfur subunit
MGERGVFADSAGRTLLDELIAEQRALSAVEEFARAHAHGEITAPRYRRLMPMTAPLPGQQLAFEVDLDRCSGCKACVTACHSLNGLDDGEAWRHVGTLISEDWRRPFQQTVTTTCHHCAEPGCLEGCPVLAYEKDPVTGIVRHLDDQCIGCQYCVMMCPYEVPQYSAQRGIVRKCDMCSQRLSAGEAPACVQACPSEAIRITIVDQSNLQAVYRSESTSSEDRANFFLPTAPDPALTLPTTRFVSKRPLAPDAVASDHADAPRQPAHTPLVWMLVLTQLGVGATVFSQVLPTTAQPKLLWLALLAMITGSAASIAHLGKPAKAWRSFLGWRTSWLSREIMAFGLFTFLLGVTVATGGSALPAIAMGLAGVLSSAFVYHATGRVFWTGIGSFGRFFGSTLLLGAAAAWFVANLTWVAVAVAMAVLGKLALEREALRKADPDGNFDARSLAATAQLMHERFGLTARARMLCAAGVVIACLCGVLLPEGRLFLAGTTLALALAGELLERYLFFRAVVPPRMPG